MNIAWRSFLLVSLSTSVGLSTLVDFALAKPVSSPSKPLIAQIPSTIHAAVAPLPVPIRLEKAQPIQLPTTAKPLVPVPFGSGQKLKGWVIEIPGNHPICTPAYYNGKLYVGGGYGAYEFYAFDAETGKLVWNYHTKDDGPTAAVVEEGCVAFNTESCTVYVLDANTGKELWKEWLGDPLMSQPAISKGRLYMAYPSGQRGTAGQGHALLCADLRTGKHIWQQKISADVISSPVVEYDRVYLSCMDGTCYCLSTSDGTIIWQKQGAATSAPVVHDGKLIVAERDGQGKDVSEGMRRFDAARGISRDDHLLAAAQAPYISGATNGTIGPQSGNAESIAFVNSAGAPAAAKAKNSWYKSMDGAVGFAALPSTAQLDKASTNLGISSISGAWGYQGARAVYSNGSVTNAQLTYVNCVNAETGKVNWRAQAKGSFITGQSQVFSTPSLGHQNLYLCSGDGHVVCMNQKNGAIHYMLATKQPISFQPALARGNIYVGTANGKLVCINANDPDADGWTAWGGNAQHNKSE